MLTDKSGLLISKSVMLKISSSWLNAGVAVLVILRAIASFIPQFDEYLGFVNAAFVLALCSLMLAYRYQK